MAAEKRCNLPRYHNLSVLDEPVHYVMHITMLASGLFFFWRVLDPRPVPQGTSYGTRIVMCWAAIAGNVPLGAYLTFKSAALYPAYEIKDRLWDLGAHADEQMGGIVIWSPGSMMFVVLLLVVIRRRGAREERLDASGRHAARPPHQSLVVANRRLAWRLATIAILVGSGVVTVVMLRQFMP